MTKTNFVKPPMKNASGRYYTKALFWEQMETVMISLRPLEHVPYTLHKDREGCINFGKRYVELADPSGYKISQELLHDYRHWQALMECQWFKVAKELWDQELEAKLTAEAIDTIRTIAKLGDANPGQALSAAKFLAEKGYRKKEEKTRGRPSKAEIEKELKKDMEEQKEIAADLSRLRVIND